MWLAVCLLAATQATTTFAQMSLLLDDEFCGDCCDHDLQLFSPLEFDFDCQPLKKDCGWTFRYDKLNWLMTGERVEVGNPNVTVLSEIIVPDALSHGAEFDVTSRPLFAADLQYTIINGLQDVAPTSGFGWGERYEFGYSKGDTGWQFSILDGPAVNTSNTFGNGQEQFGFGSIHVNFAVPDNFLLGFRDYWGTGTTQGFFIVPTATLNGPAGPGDGFADDLDGDGAEGAANFIVADIDGDGTIDDDEVVGIVIDLDDLHQFNVTFDQVNIRNTTETQGIELMKTFRLSNSHRLTKDGHKNFHVGYGVRLLKLRDQFSFSGTSPLLGTMDFSTEADNMLVGPQLRAQWTSQKGRWGWNFDGRCMLAYNFTDLDQQGSYGLDNRDALGVVTNPGLAPGALNRLISGQPNTFSYGRSEDEFSPTVEVRAELSYQFTGSIAARLGYTGIFVDNISRGAAVTNYSLPDFGFLEGGKQDIFINGGNIGFDVVY